MARTQATAFQYLNMKILQPLLIAALAITVWFLYQKQASDTEPKVNPQQNEPKSAPKAQKNKNVEDFLKEGDFSTALSLLNKTPDDQQNQEWAILKVKALDGLGRRQEALSSIESLLEKAPTNAQARILLMKANLLEIEGDKEKAGATLYEIFQKYPNSAEQEDAAYRLKDTWKAWLSSRSKDDQMINYNKVLSWLIQKAVDETVLEECYQLLERINAKLFYGPRATEGLVSFHTVKYGENLSSIAKLYQVAPSRIFQVNKLKNRNSIRTNQRLRVITGQTRILVSKSRFNMDVYLNDHFFKRYGVGLGREGKTLAMVTSISRSMSRNPSWTIPETGEVIPPNDPKNRIGTRWIGLNAGGGIGIHGTIDPSSIGKESSNGCIRLKNEDVEELYDFVMTGDEVEIF
jgi:lipoprotein-anchoring transpeptidase ErfK/SrfK